MNNKHSSYEDTRGIYQKNQLKKKKIMSFLMLSKIMWITCNFLIGEFNRLPPQPFADPAGMYNH